jgi:hypothetical protein
VIHRLAKDSVSSGHQWPVGGASVLSPGLTPKRQRRNLVPEKIPGSSPGPGCQHDCTSIGTTRMWAHPGCSLKDEEWTCKSVTVHFDPCSRICSSPMSHESKYFGLGNFRARRWSLRPAPGPSAQPYQYRVLKHRDSKNEQELYWARASSRQLSGWL